MAPQTFQLVMRSGPSPGKTFALSKSDITIGRDINADIVINSAEVSRRHARLKLEAGGYAVEDLGSTNGTFVNGQRLVGPHMLRPGETISLGEAATLSYEVAQFDPNATRVSAPAQVSAPPEPQMAPPARAAAPPPPPASYAGQVPAGPVMAAEAPPMEEKGGKTWLWAGLGCLVVVLCIIVVGAFAFDYFDFYCTPPFDMLFTCP